MHSNNLRLVLGLGFVMVSSMVRVRIRVKVIDREFVTSAKKIREF